LEQQGENVGIRDGMHLNFFYFVGTTKNLEISKPLWKFEKSYALLDTP
jgi:hypothetical protein